MTVFLMKLLFNEVVLPTKEDEKLPMLMSDTGRYKVWLMAYHRSLKLARKGPG